MDLRNRSLSLFLVARIVLPFGSAAVGNCQPGPAAPKCTGEDGKVLGLYCSGIPDEPLAKIREALRRGDSILSISFGSAGKYIIITSKEPEPITSNRIKLDLNHAMTSYQWGGKDKDAVLDLAWLYPLDSRNNYVIRVSTGDYFGSSNEVNQSPLMRAIRQKLKANKTTRIRDVAFTHDQQNWFFIYVVESGKSLFVAGDGVAPALKIIVTQFQQTLEHVALLPNGGWVFSYDRGYSSSDPNLPPGMKAALTSIGNQRKIEAIATIEDSWIIVVR
jgi:hypothetical protein